ILFGSRARGDALISSDYDLILVSPAFARMPFAERAARVLEFWTLEAPLEALCYTPEEFEQKAAGLTMIREAREQGIELRLPDASDPACNAPDLLV
ncbi:MAG TPA: nucleotidyltransferase domain-containing protein, partial [Bacillota bacterium]